jgi:hypothetical protein
MKRLLLILIFSVTATFATAAFADQPGPMIPPKARVALGMAASDQPGPMPVPK